MKQKSCCTRRMTVAWWHSTTFQVMQCVRLWSGTLVQMSWSALKKLGVYEYVKATECLKETNRAPTTTRWIDVNVGDRDKPNYPSNNCSSRVQVGREA